jgi:hypothetical protein
MIAESFPSILFRSDQSESHNLIVLKRSTPLARMWAEGFYCLYARPSTSEGSVAIIQTSFCDTT